VDKPVTTLVNNNSQKADKPDDKSANNNSSASQNEYSRGYYSDYYNSSDYYYSSYDIDFDQLTQDLLNANYNLESLKNIYSECMKQRPVTEMTTDQKKFLDTLYQEIEKKKKIKNKK
jgi:hypothetical protein